MFGVFSMNARCMMNISAPKNDGRINGSFSMSLCILYSAKLQRAFDAIDIGSG